MGRVRRTGGTPQRVPECSNAADGPFSAACQGAHGYLPGLRVSRAGDPHWRAEAARAIGGVRPGRAARDQPDPCPGGPAPAGGSGPGQHPAPPRGGGGGPVTRGGGEHLRGARLSGEPGLPPGAGRPHARPDLPDRRAGGGLHEADLAGGHRRGDGPPTTASTTPSTAPPETRASSS